MACAMPLKEGEGTEATIEHTNAYEADVEDAEQVEMNQGTEHEQNTITFKNSSDGAKTPEFYFKREQPDVVDELM